MNLIKTEIEGAYIIEPRVLKDSRGYFFESFNQREFNNCIGYKVVFVQDNESKSFKNVVRGLHFQKPPYAQAKLLRVVKGAVIDVAVDIRRDSPTYGQYVAVELSEDNHRQFYIPHGFAHGFSVLTDEVIFQYKCDNFYHPESEGAIRWDDETLNIDWGINLSDAIISDKDKVTPLFKEFKSPF